MNSLISLTDKQINTIIDLIDSEQYAVTDDNLNEELNDLRRVLKNKGRTYSTMNEDTEYTSRHAYTPSYEEHGREMVERHTPMPPTYPQYSADDVASCITNGTDYRDCVDYMVQSMKTNENE
tara:strand:+ start:273 stop:638 length:366 start_codon:yes stop_codon:yes gene_type:complete